MNNTKELSKAPTKTPAKSKEPSVGQQALDMWHGYLNKDVINDFQALPSYARLTMLQSIPEAYIKSRDVGGKQVPYIDHFFSEKALNFAFNFHVNVEVINSKVNAQPKYTEVNLQVRFTFYDERTEREIFRTVFSGHKGYKNNAITEADVYKAALSKAYTVVARTFGIGSNIELKKGKKESFAKREEEAYNATPQEPPAKSFGGAGSAGAAKPQW